VELPNRTLYAVCATVAIMAIAARTQTASPPILDEDQEPVVAEAYDERAEQLRQNELRLEQALRRSPRQASPTVYYTASGQTQPVAVSGSRSQTRSQIPHTTIGRSEPGFVERPSVQNEPATVEPMEQEVEADMAEEETVVMDRPAQSGELTDGAVYQLMVSSLDEEDRRAFRATWAYMSPEERRAMLDQARSELSGQ